MNNKEFKGIIKNKIFITNMIVILFMMFSLGFKYIIDQFMLFDYEVIIFTIGVFVIFYIIYRLSNVLYIGIISVMWYCFFLKKYNWITLFLSNQKVISSLKELNYIFLGATVLMSCIILLKSIIIFFTSNSIIYLNENKLDLNEIDTILDIYIKELNTNSIDEEVDIKVTNKKLSTVLMQKVNSKIVLVEKSTFLNLKSEITVILLAIFTSGLGGSIELKDKAIVIIVLITLLGIQIVKAFINKKERLLEIRLKYLKEELKYIQKLKYIDEVYNYLYLDRNNLRNNLVSLLEEDMLKKAKSKITESTYQYSFYDIKEFAITTVELYKEKVFKEKLTNLIIYAEANINYNLEQKEYIENLVKAYIESCEWTDEDTSDLLVRIEYEHRDCCWRNNSDESRVVVSYKPNLFIEYIKQMKWFEILKIIIKNKKIGTLIIGVYVIFMLSEKVDDELSEENNNIKLYRYSYNEIQQKVNSNYIKLEDIEKLADIFNLKRTNINAYQ